MRLGCIGALLVLDGCAYGLASGATKLRVGVTNRTPVTMTLAEYHQNRPSKRWLELKDCRVSILESMWSEKNGSIEAVYIPLTTVGGDDNEKPQAVLESNSPDTRSLANELRSKDEAALLMDMVQNSDKGYGRAHGKQSRQLMGRCRQRNP